jgi:uncharacterized membrane protein YdjX (TVP38/TMEM64 family)
MQTREHSEIATITPPTTQRQALVETDQPQGQPWWQRLALSRGFQGIVLVCVGAFFLYRWVDAMGGPEAFRQRFGLWSVAVVIPVQTLLTASPFPSEITAVLQAGLHGFWLGALINWICWTLGSILEFALARRLATDFDIEAKLKKMPQWIQRFPVHHPLFLMLGRYVPFGFHLVNVSASFYRVPLWRQVWCAALSIPLAAVLSSALANGMLAGILD